MTTTATNRNETDLLDRVDLIRLDASRRLDLTRRAEMGQFLTPAPVARFMAALSQAIGEELRLIDPGAGVGSLTAAWVAEVCSRQQKPAAIHITAYEADSELAELLRHTMRDCELTCQCAEIVFQSEVIEGDFIRAAVEILSERGLFASQRRQFNCAILNPPYSKLHSESEARHLLGSVGIETSNLYSAFLWLVFRLLEDGGEMVAITPRSFCNGPYFRPFRAAFLREMSLRRIHVFESRKSAFKDADVLQENIIFRAVKSRCPGEVTVSSSTEPTDIDLSYRVVNSEELVIRGDRDFVIHIVPDELGTLFAKQVAGFAATLSDLNLEVSTGRVVDFAQRNPWPLMPTATRRL